MTFAEFEAEVRPMFNDICLLHTCDLARLIGAGSDIADYYYIAMDVHGKVVYHSAVGHCDSLRSLHCYDALESRFTFNGVLPAETFLSVDRPDDDRLYRQPRLET